MYFILVVHTQLFDNKLTECYVWGFREGLPYSRAGIYIGLFGQKVFMKTRIGLVAEWNERDSLTVLFFFLLLLLTLILKSLKEIKIS